MTVTELTAPLVVQGARSFHVVTGLEVLDESKETAASWAAPHITLRPDFGWIVGRFVEADKPNRNGHIFPLENLRGRHSAVVHTPMNMLHRAHHVVGTYTASELLNGSGTKPMPMAASLLAAELLNPHVETVSAFWRYAFPDEYRAVQQAFREGSAWQSMEAVPRTITCQADGLEFPYRGPLHDSYCSHMRSSPRAQRVLNDAHFVGGAIIIPPTRPGWGNADIRDVAGVIEEHEDEANQTYEAIAASAAHLDAGTWTQVMVRVLAVAFPDDAKPAPRFFGGFTIPQDAEWTAETGRDYSAEDRRQMAKNGQAMNDGSFPIKDAVDVKAAVHLARTPAQRDHVMKRATALGCMDLIPAGWKKESSASYVGHGMQMPTAKDGVLSPHDTPVVDVAWDHALMRRRLPGTKGHGQAIHVKNYGAPEDAFKMAFAWYDKSAADPNGDGLPDAKRNWKLIHHMVSADGTVGAANVTALRNAIGYLNGARAGVAIPDGDKEAVWEHLAAHLRDAQVSPPPLHAAEWAQAPTDGAMVCITPPAEIAAVLAQLGDEPADQLHVTLAYLGNVTGDSVELDPDIEEEEGDDDGASSKDSVLAAVAAFAAGAPAFVAMVSGLGQFALGDGEAVTYASIDAPGMPELRERLCAALDAAGVAVARDHGLSPHITLRYGAVADAGVPLSDLPAGLDWPVEALEVWWSGEKYEFQLADGKVDFSS